MKINYRRIIKVLSSCVAILIVLVVSVVHPAMAAAQNYKLSDLPMRVVNNDGIVTFSYNIGYIDPYVAISDEEGKLYTSGLGCYWPIQAGWLDVGDNDEDKVTFAISSLGASASPSSKVGLLDVSDLKKYSTLQYNYRFDVDSGISNGTAWVKFRYFLAIYSYDAQKNYISTQQTPVKQSVTNSDGDQFHIDEVAEFILPENAVYIAPKITVALSTVNFVDSTSMYIEVFPSTLSFSIDSVIENSLTMQNIKEKLGDIDDTLGSIDQSIQEGNNKLDEIINGNDEMSNQAQDKHEDQQELDSAAQDAMNDIDDRTDLDNVLPEGAMDPEDLGEYADWSDDEAWVQWRHLLSPLFDNDLVVEIMMALIAFINISVIFMGR